MSTPLAREALSYASRLLDRDAATLLESLEIVDVDGLRIVVEGLVESMRLMIARRVDTVDTPTQTRAVIDDAVFTSLLCAVLIGGHLGRKNLL